jgi:dodecin
MQACQCSCRTAGLRIEVDAVNTPFVTFVANAHNACSPIKSIEENTMTVARVTEIISVSKKSFDDALAKGIARANKTLKNVKGVWIKDQEVTIDDGKVTGYKVS